MRWWLSGVFLGIGWQISGFPLGKLSGRLRRVNMLSLVYLARKIERCFHESQRERLLDQN